jgi:hypothetical protein
MEGKIHFRVRKGPTTVHIWSQMNPIHTHAIFLHDNVNIILPLLSCLLPSDLFPPGCPNKILYAFLVCACGTAHLVLLDLVVIATLSQEYMLWSSSLCSSNYIQPTIASSLLRPNTLSSGTFTLCPSQEFGGPHRVASVRTGTPK